MTRVVITGAGIVSPIGVGVDAYWSQFVRGTSGVRPTTRFQYPGSPESVNAAVVDDDLSQLLPCKDSTWNAARTTTFALAATKLAIADAGLDLATLDLRNVGIAFGTTLSCVSLMSSFDRRAIEQGPRLSDPGVFPDTGFSAPACRISVLLGPCAFNVTLSNGETAVLDALEYACSFIRSGRAHTVLVGGSEEISTESVFGFAETKARHSRANGRRCPDPQHNECPVLGEGAGVIVIESLDHARNRSSRVLAEVLSCASTCDPRRLHHSAAGLEPACLAVRNALEKSALAAKDIDFVCHGTNGLQTIDAIESRVLNRVFGHEQPIRSDPASQIGGSYSAGGAMKLITAAMALYAGVAPPETRSRPDMQASRPINSAEPRGPSAGIVTSLAACGSNAAVVLRAWDCAA
jgi:3-oxoacyl-[acyl-carrier-protein] synthase II